MALNPNPEGMTGPVVNLPYIPDTRNVFGIRTNQNIPLPSPQTQQQPQQQSVMTSGVARSSGYGEPDTSSTYLSSSGTSGSVGGGGISYSVANWTSQMGKRLGNHIRDNKKWYIGLTLTAVGAGALALRSRHKHQQQSEEIIKAFNKVIYDPTQRTAIKTKGCGRYVNVDSSGQLYLSKTQKSFFTVSTTFSPEINGNRLCRIFYANPILASPFSGEQVQQQSYEDELKDNVVENNQQHVAWRWKLPEHCDTWRISMTNFVGSSNVVWRMVEQYDEHSRHGTGIFVLYPFVKSHSTGDRSNGGSSSGGCVSSPPIVTSMKLSSVSPGFDTSSSSSTSSSTFDSSTTSLMPAWSESSSQQPDDILVTTTRKDQPSSASSSSATAVLKPLQFVFELP